VFQYFTVHRQYYFSSVPVLHCSQAVLFVKCSCTSLFTGSTIFQVFQYFTVHRQYYFSSVPVLHFTGSTIFQVFQYFTVHRQYYFSNVPVLHCSQAVLCINI
jgi:hypothetical protein